MVPYPQRLVSLEPSVTATLLALGQRERLVAVSEHDVRLVGEAAITGLPRVPCTWSIRAADVTPLRPDLVIGSVPMRGESVAELLKAGLDVLWLYPHTLASVQRHIRLLAALTGVPEAGERIIQEMDETFARLKAATAGRPRRRVYVEIWPRPRMTGPAWHVDLVALAGGTFVPEGPNRQVTDEEVIAADPEVIVIAWAGVDDPPLERVYRRSGWERITAVREGRVVAVPEIWINAPGPNLARGARLLAQAIWADAPLPVDR